MKMEGHLNRYLFLSAAVAMAFTGTPALAQSGEFDSLRAAPGGQRSSQTWTPETLRGARTLPLPQVNPADVRAAGRTGERASLPDISGQSAEADLGGGGGQSGQRMSGDVRQKPLHWAGKMWGRDAQGDFSCSAQFIAPQLVLTAAHCVQNNETGEWYNDIVFALQYENGSFSEFYDYYCVAANTGWVQPGFESWLYDFAVIKVDKPTTTGHFGTHWGWQGAYDGVIKIGYPGGVENGEVIQVEEGPIRLVEGVVELTHGNPADQRGSSGGAWLGTSNGQLPGGYYAISLESFGFDDQPGVSYGPYLAQDFKNLVDYAQNDCQ